MLDSQVYPLLGWILTINLSQCLLRNNASFGQKEDGFIARSEQQSVPSLWADLRSLFQPNLSGLLVGFESHLGKETGFEEHIHNEGSLYLSPVQAWIEKACEKGLSPWQGFEGIQVHDLFYHSSSIPTKVMTFT